mgnify:CR=1 FL=1
MDVVLLDLKQVYEAQLNCYSISYSVIKENMIPDINPQNMTFEHKSSQRIIVLTMF